MVVFFLPDRIGVINGEGIGGESTGRWKSLSILSHQGMDQTEERFAEGAGTLREFAKEENGN